MMKRRTLTERLLAAALCLVLLVGLFPIGALDVAAADAALGTVAAATEGLAVTGSNTANVAVTLDRVVTLEKLEANSAGRQNGWYVGVAITAPADYVSGAKFNCYRPEDNNNLGVAFDEAKDTADGNVITMWALITEAWIKAGEITYKWEMDWDGDDAVDQTVTLTVDPAKVILMDGETKVYPVYGTVSVDSEYQAFAAVTGENTDNTVLTVNGASVEYNDEKQGWIITATVTAPVGTTEAKEGQNVIENVMTYDLVLKPNNGSYTGISGEISGTFYWDGTQQQLTLKAENITLVQKTQTVSFTESYTEVTKQMRYTGFSVTGGSFTNAAISDCSNAVFTYQSSNTGVATVNKDGKVSYKKTGTAVITVTATDPTGVYAPATVSYTLNVAGAYGELIFKNGDSVTLTYGEQTTYSNPATWNNSSDRIEYFSDNTSVATVDATGTVTIVGVGTANITATRSGQYIQTATKSYVLTVNPGNQKDFGFTATEEDLDLTFTPDLTHTYTVSGIKTTEEVQFSVTTQDTGIIGETMAVLKNADGTYSVTVEILGTGSFTLKAVAPADSKYNEATDEITVSVKALQSDIAFDVTEAVALTYEPNLTYDVQLLGFATGVENLRVSIVEANPSDVATVAIVDDVATVSVAKAGTFKLQAYAEGNAYYKDSEKITLEFTVAKADQTIAFPKTDVAFARGEVKKYQQLAAETGEHYGTGTITYKILSGELEYKSFNEADGTVELKKKKTGTLVIQATKAADERYNETTATYTLSIGFEAAPVPSYTLSAVTGNAGWYKANGEEAPVTIFAPDGYLISFEEDEDGAWEASVPYSLEGKNNPIIYLKNKDKGGVTAAVTVEELAIDTEAPTCTITYEKDVWGSLLEDITFGYYKAETRAMIAASDASDKTNTVSGIAAVYYRLDEDSEWVKREFTGAAVNCQVAVYIPTEYRGKVQFYAEDVAGNVEAVNIGSATVVVDSISPTMTVSYSYAQPEGAEGNPFYEVDGVIYSRYTTTAVLTVTDANFDLSVLEQDTPVVTVDGAAQNVTWTEADGAWVSSDVVIEGDGDHVLAVTFADRSQNPMEPYSKEIHIDTKAPVVSFAYETEDTDLCDNENITAVITVEEHNFKAAEVVIVGTDIAGNTVYSSTVSDWEHEENTDIYTAKIPLETSANYVLTVNAYDLAGNASTGVTDGDTVVTVDHEAPTDLAIAYTNDVWGEVMEALSFGYYDAEMTVTISAADATSGVAEIFYNYDGEWKSAVPADGQISFTIAPQYRGKVQYYAADRAGNDTKVDGEAATGNVEVIADSEKPVISVSWSDAQQVTEDGTRYYSEKAVATVTITEANFFNGEAEASGKGEGVLIFVNNEAGKLDSKEWKQAVDADGNPIADTWINTVTLSAEGDYVLNVQYTDRSKNEAEAYTSDTITLDHTNPKVSVNIDAAENRIYSDKNMTVTVTVEEHNFNADDVKFILTSINSSDAAVEAPVSYGEWKSNGDVHTIDVTFSVDANYTLDVEYADMAKRAANNLPVQMLTVDKVAPVIASVTYSDGIVAGYYNAPMKVSVLVTDDTAGVDRFVYSYIKHAGVSSVNAELLNQTDAAITHEAGTNKYTVIFQIPKENLTNKNQFNGYVDVTAYDRSGNNSNENQKEEQTVIVDNIAPVANVTFNAPVNTKNDVSYYAGDINATIEINEANFFSNDVNVTVTRNGANYPVTVKWTNNSVDRHTGTFTLTEDGDYVVKVSYKDRSNNQMTAYTSNQLTLDTELPTITVNNIVSDSANTDAVYSFTITAKDTNFDLDAFVASLNAVVYNADGTFTTESIDLGAPVEVEAGKTYAYEITNLEKDAIYTLSCSMTDLAGNSYSKMLLDDGKEYGEVRFSINRDGSTFYLDENTTELVNDYYNKNVVNDLVVFEINADVLEEHSVTMNGKELTEGTDYTVTTEGGNGSWMKYTYTVNKALFEAEGEYQVVISSKDKAGNNAFSDVKNATVRFVVDRTAPVITVTGMANGGRYQTESQTVTLIPTDDGGALSSILVKLVDDDGKTIKELINLSGEELAEALENGDGRLSFQIGEGLYQNVQIVCEDCSSSEEGHNVYDETFEDLSVSASGFMIFWANRALRYGVMFLLLLLLLVVIYLLTRKKKKN